jgi:hypothetical protein
MAARVQTISSRAMRTARYLGDLESDLTTPMAAVVAQKCRLFFLSTSDHAFFGKGGDLGG